MKTASIILAAGQGTRMRSKLPKVMHTILGKPLIWHAIKAVKELSDLPPVVVVGHGADLVRQSVADQAQFALQAEQLGTGHAVMMAESALSGKADLILITFADMPLLRAETLEALIRLHQSGTAPLTMTSVVGDVPRGFGRILRDADGKVQAVAVVRAVSFFETEYHLITDKGPVKLPFPLRSSIQGLVDGQLVHHDHSAVLHRGRVRACAGCCSCCSCCKVISFSQRIKKAASSDAAFFITNPEVFSF